MSRNYRKYDEDFKQGAVVPVVDLAADDVGVAPRQTR